MVLARLVLRPDRAMALAALGLGAAILLPVLGSLVVAGLAPQLPSAYVAYAGAEGALDLTGLSPTLVVAADDADPDRVAYRVGDPVVAPGQALAMPEAAAPGVPRAPMALEGLSPRAVLVHPDDLGAAHDVLAVFPGPVAIPGAIAAHARGADAFEAASAAQLQRQSLVLVALSIPAVALVAFAFARQETRARRRQSAVFVALGSRWSAVALIAARAFVTAASGAAVALAVGYSLYRWGAPILHPADAPRLMLVVSIAAPAAAAAFAGIAASWLLGRDVGVLRSEGSEGEDDLAVPLPPGARPLLLGLRPLGTLLLCALLFAADVGFPVAAARVPASLAGADGEWVLGAEDGLTVGKGLAAAAANVAWLDPRVDDAVAETVVPTLVDGRPAVVRGGTWERLSSYHGLALRGEAPGVDGVALGRRLAHHLGAGVGDRVAVQGGDRADVVTLAVTGIVSGPRLLEDEAFVSEPVGRRLADLPPGQAMLVRVRPDTQAALAALQRAGPEIVVASVALEPDRPAAGSVAAVAIRVANLGAQPGERELTVRVNGQAVSVELARVAGHGEATLRVAVLVPPGPLRIDVNPTATAEASAPHWTWEAPATVAAGTPVAARLLEDGRPAAAVEAGLFRDAGAAAAGDAAARGTTDADGRVSLTPPGPGPWLLGTLAGERAYTQVQVTGTGGLVVEAVWTEPATLGLGVTNRVVAQVRNLGGTPAGTVVAAFADGLRFAEAAVELGAGEATTVAFPLYIIAPIGNVTVGDRTLTLGTQAARDPAGNLTPPAPPAGPEDPPGRPGEQVQAQVADRALGDARAVLVGLAGSAIASTLAVVVLSTQRALAGRRHVLALLGALGWDAARIRQRAAAEGAALGGLAALTALLPAKLIFLALGQWGPVVFGHGLPDPVTPMFALQAVAAFAGICGLAAYASAGGEAARAAALR